MNRKVLFTMLVAMTFSAMACGDNDDDLSKPEPCSQIQPTEDHLLNNLQNAYRERRIECYMELLAADFRFYPDPDTRSQLGVEFWTRSQDSLATSRLFNSTDVKRIAVDLAWPAGSAVSRGYLAPYAGWPRLFLTDVFLDVDIEPAGQETNTYRVEDQTQRFFFRRGRTNPPSGPADTLLYIVEWRDEGPREGKGNRPNAVLPATWSSIKAGLAE